MFGGGVGGEPLYAQINREQKKRGLLDDPIPQSQLQQSYYHYHHHHHHHHHNNNIDNYGNASEPTLWKGGEFNGIYFGLMFFLLL